MNDDLTNNVAQIRDLALRPAAGSVQHGHSQTFQPPQNLDGALKAVHRIDGLPVIKNITLYSPLHTQNNRLITDGRSTKRRRIDCYRYKHKM